MRPKNLGDQRSGFHAGQLPALADQEGNVLPSRVGSESEAARSLIEELKARNVDLDAQLSRHQQAQVLAFTSLVQSRLEPATTYTNWCEWESFSQYTRVSLPATLAERAPSSRNRSRRPNADGCTVPGTVLRAHAVFFTYKTMRDAAGSTRSASILQMKQLVAHKYGATWVLIRSDPGVKQVENGTYLRSLRADHEEHVELQLACLALRMPDATQGPTGFWMR